MERSVIPSRCPAGTGVRVLQGGGHHFARPVQSGVRGHEKGLTVPGQLKLATTCAHKPRLLSVDTVHHEAIAGTDCRPPLSPLRGHDECSLRSSTVARTADAGVDPHWPPSTDAAGSWTKGAGRARGLGDCAGSLFNGSERGRPRSNFLLRPRQI